jgi:hypothetical protein
MNNWYNEHYPRDPDRAVCVVRSKKEIIGKVLMGNEDSYRFLSELILKAGDCEVDYEPKL